MEAITIGCNIEAVTTGGKVLSVIVGVLGLLIIPMFTVYVNNIVSVFHTVTSAAAERLPEVPKKGLPQTKTTKRTKIKTTAATVNMRFASLDWVNVLNRLKEKDYPERDDDFRRIYGIQNH